MTRNEIIETAARIKEADTWTDELLDLLRELAEEAGVSVTDESEPYDICIAVQKKLDIDLGE